MNELSHDHGLDGYGAKTNSRLMHKSFYGSTAVATETHAAGATLAKNSINALANQEWQKTGLEGFFPPELISLLGQLTAGIGFQLETIMDFLTEAVNAEALRQKFGKPQVPGALAVAINLTNLAEQAFEETQNVANRAEQKIAWIKAEIQKIILVWLINEENRYQATISELEKTELKISNLNLTTDQALAESILVKKNLLQNKNELKLLIQKTQAKIANFFNKIFESAPLKTAEVLVFAAQKSTVNVSPLETSQAIPILSSS